MRNEARFLPQLGQYLVLIHSEAFFLLAPLLLSPFSPHFPITRFAVSIQAPLSLLLLFLLSAAAASLLLFTTTRFDSTPFYEKCLSRTFSQSSSRRPNPSAISLAPDGSHDDDVGDLDSASSASMSAATFFA